MEKQVVIQIRISHQLITVERWVLGKWDFITPVGSLVTSKCNRQMLFSIINSLILTYLMCFNKYNPQINPVQPLGSLKLFFSLFDRILQSLTTSLVFQYDTMFQIHILYFLTHTWNRPFLQWALVHFIEMWKMVLRETPTSTRGVHRY